MGIAEVKLWKSNFIYSWKRWKLSKAKQYKKNYLGFNIGIDNNELTAVDCVLSNKLEYDKHDCIIYVIANSIGVYFAMHTLQIYDIELRDLY